MGERRITIHKLDHAGREVISYPGELVFDDGEVVVVRCIFEPREVRLGDLTFSQGDLLIECYYRHQPFNVFTLYAPTGRLKGWYCNVLERTLFSDGSIRWADLALDLLVTPDGARTVLDEDEFEALAPSQSQREQARQALETLSRWHAERAFPFDLA